MFDRDVLAPVMAAAGLKALIASLGSEPTPLNGDATEGTARITLGEGGYERRLCRDDRNRIDDELVELDEAERITRRERIESRYRKVRKLQEKKERIDTEIQQR